MTDKISVFLTSAQKRKFETGKTFQLSATQLNAGTGKFHVEIEMTSKNHKQLLRNVSKNKGYRFTSEKIVGGSIFGKVLQSVAKAVAPTVLDKIGDYTGQKGITNALKGSADGLIDIGVNKITGGKLKKGSVEMKEHMARLRSMRKGKGVVVEGEGILDDIRNGFNRTFNPKLGRKIKKALTSPIAKNIYKSVADIGLDALGAYTGNPLVGAIGSQVANSAIDGLGVRRNRKNTMVVGGTLVKGVPSVQMNHNARVVRVGGSFRSAGGMLYGGSMISP